MTGEQREKRLYYISGPMTGLPEMNFPAFHAAAAAINETGRFIAVSPAGIAEVPGQGWAYCWRLATHDK